MATTKHTFIVVKVEKDGTREEIGRETFEGEDYQTFNEQQALERILADKVAYGFGYDASMEAYVYKGHLIPRELFRGLDVELLSKARPPTK